MSPSARRANRVRHILLVVFSVAPLSSILCFAQTAPIVPGGFLEKATSGDVRPRLSASQMQSMLPARGLFTFPAPYATEGIRLTNAGDCAGGADCLNYVGYSYWRNINNHLGSDTMYIFLGLSKARGGGGPTLFSYNKVTDVVTKVGPLFSPTDPFSDATGEGWYFSATMPNALYIQDGPKLLRFDVLTKQFTTVFDATTRFGSGYTIWQTHSSNDDRVHSATVVPPGGGVAGCMAYRENTQQFFFYPTVRGDYDECQVDKSGDWLVIKENVDGAAGYDNRIINLNTGTETLLLDQNGAGGHSDLGYGYMIAADDWNPLPSAVRLWKFAQSPLQGSIIYYMTDWSTDVGHISHANAKSGIAPEQQYQCSSNASRYDVPRGNEIVCTRLDTSMDVLVVAPVMTDLNASGGGDDYSKVPKGNLDVSGQYFMWTSNLGGSRLDAFIVKVPSYRLTASGIDVTAPTVAVTAPGAGSSVSGTVTVTAAASDDVGVDGVQLRLDGAPLGSEIASSPYTTTWNTGSAPAGTHLLTATARDAAGNSSTSAAVAVTVGGSTGSGGSGSTGSGSSSGIQSGLIGYWKFEEPSGSLVLDTSASLMDATLASVPQRITGPRGHALSFDGVSDSVMVGQRSSQNAYPITIAAWVRFGNSATGGLVSKYYYGVPNGYQIFASSGKICARYFKDSSSYVGDTGVCPMAISGYGDGSWHHVAFVVDDSGGTLYVDGAQKATMPWTGIPGPTTNLRTLFFGKYSGSPTPFLKGAIDEVRLYNRALSASDVAAVKNYVPPGGDYTPPSITTVAATGVTASASSIAWITNEGSDSIVQYGPSSAYGGRTPLGSSMTLSHALVLSGLAADSVYHYRVRSRDAAGNVTVSPDATFQTAAAATVSGGGLGGAQPVVWTSLVNSTATAGTLQKTSGATDLDDAGAVSQQKIVSGDGYVEFTVPEASTLRYVGLSNGNPGTTATEIQYAIRLQFGNAEVREAGVYQGDTPAAPGDLFRVSVTAGVVKYSKNGSVFYISRTVPAYPLLVDTSLVELGTTVANAQILGGV